MTEENMQMSLKQILLKEKAGLKHNLPKISPIEHLSVMSLPVDGAITPVRAVELCIDIPIGES